MSTGMMLAEKVLHLLGQDGIIMPSFAFQSSILPIIVVQVVCLMVIILNRRQSRVQIKKKNGTTETSKTRTSFVLALLSLTTAFSIWSTVSLEWHSIKTSKRLSDFTSKEEHLPNLFNATIRELQYGLQSGQYSSVQLVEAYLARIEEVNSVVHAVIETVPKDLLYAQAQQSDQERSIKGGRGYLHGIPILVKDNIATDVSLGLNTTAGSFALLNSVPPGDASIIERLRKAGAIILGKTNMSVWAQGRGETTQGWSPRGGYTSSAFQRKGNACSSSSGAGVSASIGLAAANIGTETDGSIICPSTRNGVVGMKPTVGFASRFGIIPISSSQDTAGPIVQSVEDAAIILTSIFTPKTAFQIRLDPAVELQPKRVAKGIDYAKELMNLRLEEMEKPLQDVRIGVLKGAFIDPKANSFDSQVVDIYYESLKQLEASGATLVDVEIPFVSKGYDDLKTNKSTIFLTEFTETINSYLSYLRKIPSGIYDFAGLIDFAYRHPELELPTNETDQSFFLKSLYNPMFQPVIPGQANLSRKFNETYIAAKENAELVHKELIQVMKRYKLSAFVGPSDSAIYSVAAKVGGPSITVPANFLRLTGTVEPDHKARPLWPFNGAPVGLCFISTRWQEENLLKVARGFEIMQIRSQRGGYDGLIRTFKEATPTTQLSHIMAKSAKL